MYIVLEGIDGVGKTTHIAYLHQWLESKGYIVEKLVEPTDSDVGKLIRKQLLNPDIITDTNQQILSLLFAADRLTLKKKIANTKKSKERILISDRSFYSSIAYQNNESISKDWIYDINKYMPRPDLTIILDLDPKDAIRRCDGTDTFENINFLKKTRNSYKKLLKYPNTIKIDATPSKSEVQEEIQKAIAEKLNI